MLTTSTLMVGKVLSLLLFHYFLSCLKLLNTYVSDLSETDLENLVKTYYVPFDLLPHLLDPNLTMDRLPGNAIGDWFSFAKRKSKKDVCMDDGPSSIKKWKKKFFIIDRRAIPDYLTWRNLHSCVSDDLPLCPALSQLHDPSGHRDRYYQNDVERLCALHIRLCEMNEAILVRSELSSV
ncbi:hypothetical protein Tco_1338677 [Tanacetum coccineum]